jgi:hypothetical protein
MQNSLTEAKCEYGFQIEIVKMWRKIYLCVLLWAIYESITFAEIRWPVMECAMVYELLRL